MKNPSSPVTDKTTMEALIQASAALLLYFYNDSCAPCVALRPKVNEMLVEQFPLMQHAYINAAIYPELSASAGVFASPTIIVYFDGKENFRVSKYVSVQELSDRIQRYYSLRFE
ncbi:MAG: thioredoxin family protein [Lentimicrobium sp.]|jgi:thioredoxin-like negative regulator of GroEL|nr:thioredoxin family protein [Lentimicrobium sp.]MDD2528171.1 thioredoxin family protein [Lentimicrobiaceae bacterium]MDD4599115.1 thioredoxin family protein [Lentimicrobiaceae bacterium]MDY0027138.1 thioredoxin family protein [Lentimicrobium sp.]